MSPGDATRPAIFLDRDGVLNELVPDPRSGRPESPLHVEDVQLVPGVAEGVLRLREAGYLVVGVTNQPAAAKGIISIDELLGVQARVVSLLADQGVALDGWRMCLHHPDGTVPDLAKSCDCRKPRPGMVFDAAKALNLDLAMSWMIGDTDADVAAGQAAGCRTVLVEHPASSHKRGGAISPDRRAPDLVQAAVLVVPRPSDPRSEEDDLGGSSSQGPLARKGRERRRRTPPDVLWDVLIGAVVVVLMASPVLFTDRAFMIDFTNEAWLGLVMSHSLSHGLPPTFFINTGDGVFNPVFAFYGGPLFALFGLLTDIFGGSVFAGLDVMIILAFSAAYGGTAWISRQCGLRGRLVHVPAIVVASGAYLLSDLYGRGDLAEFAALSIIPLVVASAVHLARARSWTPGPTILLILSVIIFTGSHNISLLWGTMVGAVVLLGLAVALRPRSLPVKRLCAVAGLIVLAIMVNGWYLLPDLSFGGSTVVAAPAHVGATFFDTPGLLFNPLRAVPSQSTSPALYVQAPVWFLAWSAGCGIWIWTKRSLVEIRKSWTALAVLLSGLFVLIIDTPLWRRIPLRLQVLQFPFRLNGFVLLLTAALVLVSLLALQHELVGTGRSRVVPMFVVLLVGATVISIGLGVWQVWVPRTCFANSNCAPNRSAGLASVNVYPATWYAGNGYTDTTAPVVSVTPGRMFSFSPDLVDAHGDSLVATVDLPGGTQPILTNILGGPQLVSIGGGIERVGRNKAGLVVVRRTAPGDGPIRVVIQTADGPAIRLGRWLSLAGLITLGLILSNQVLLGAYRRRRA